MTRSRSDLVWIPTFAVLVAFAVPWPLWGVDRVVAGLPVWIWHAAWLGLTLPSGSLTVGVSLLTAATEGGDASRFAVASD